LLFVGQSDGQFVSCHGVTSVLYFSSAPDYVAVLTRISLQFP